jgi:hypothetical protein
VPGFGDTRGFATPGPPPGSSGIGIAPTTASPSRDFVPTAPVAPTVGRPLPVKAIGAAAGAALLLGLAVWQGPKLFTPSDLSQAQKLLDEGLAEDALRHLDAAVRKDDNRKQVPRLLLLKGQALHELKRHEEEWEALNKVPNSELAQMSQRVFMGLMEDFGGSSRDQGLTRLLDRPLNDKALREAFRPRAAEAVKKTPPAEPLAYSVVRYWDLLSTDKSDKGEVAEAYGTLITARLESLDGADCELKDRAAKRLGELGDTDAEEVLQKLVDSPRRRGFMGFGSDCGHGEAEASLNRLRNKK